MISFLVLFFESLCEESANLMKKEFEMSMTDGELTFFFGLKSNKQVK